MSSKFARDLRFHEALQTTIIRQITKENGEIKKYSQNPLELCTNLYVWGGLIFAYYCVWTYKWCLVYVCV